jgi:hypothetical protein
MSTTERTRDKVVPTRLLGGPLLFRISGEPKPAQVAYTLVFRLSRRDIAQRGEHTYFGGVGLPYGRFEVAGGTPIALYVFGPKRRNCFATDLRRASFDPAVMRKLDALPVGQRVRVLIKPRTRRPDGHTEPGRTYVRRPRIRTGVFRLRDAAGQRQLRGIGCSGLTS